MPRIDFYILAAQGADARAQFSCTLAAQAWRDGMNVHIITDDEPSAAHLDSLLWTFEPTSFVPHGRASLAGQNPIVISPDPQPGQLLINLSNATPGDWTERSQVAEIISADEPIRQAGRDRYRQYQQAGAKPRTHHID